MGIRTKFNPMGGGELYCPGVKQFYSLGKLYAYKDESGNLYARVHNSCDTAGTCGLIHISGVYGIFGCSPAYISGGMVGTSSLDVVCDVLFYTTSSGLHWIERRGDYNTTLRAGVYDIKKYTCDTLNNYLLADNSKVISITPCTDTNYTTYSFYVCTDNYKIYQVSSDGTTCTSIASSNNVISTGALSTYASARYINQINPGMTRYNYNTDRVYSLTSNTDPTVLPLRTPQSYSIDSGDNPYGLTDYGTKVGTDFAVVDYNSNFEQNSVKAYQAFVRTKYEAPYLRNVKIPYSPNGANPAYLTLYYYKPFHINSAQLCYGYIPENCPLNIYGSMDNSSWTQVVSTNIPRTYYESDDNEPIDITFLPGYTENSVYSYYKFTCYCPSSNKSTSQVSFILNVKRDSYTEQPYDPT